MELLIGLVLAIHLICVNLSAAGPFISCWLDWREGKKGDKYSAEVAGVVGRWLLSAAIWSLLIGGALGLLVGVLVWSDGYGQVIKVLGRRIFFGVWEYIFSLALFAIALVWWKRSTEHTTKKRIIRIFLVLLGASNLIYHFPPLFVLMANLANGHPVEEVVFVSEMMKPAVLSRALHFALASFAVSGVALIWWDRWGRGKTDDPERIAASWGGWIALIPTVLQVIVGTWVLLAMPKEAQKQLMGGNLLGTIAFMVSLILAFALMHMLAKTALRRNEQAMAMSVIMMLATIVLMTIGMRLARVPPADDEAHHSPNYSNKLI